MAVYEKGRRAGSTSFVMFALPNAAGHCRLGITVTRKVGSSVQRNRIKRVLRDVFRRHRAELAPGLDLVLNARRGASDVPTAVLEREFLDRFGEISRRFRS
jgi:ribonuclease P protein component